MCVPVVEGGRPGIPVNVTALRSGRGMFRLGRLGSGGRPAGSGINPKKQNHVRHYFNYSQAQRSLQVKTHIQR